MKVRDIALGSVMIAMFIALGVVFKGNVRPIQTYMEIIKIVIITLAIKHITSKGRVVFIASCICLCLILLPIQDTLVYNVPSVFCGWVLGIQEENTKNFFRFLVFLLVNSLMIIYEFFMFNIFTGSNLFYMYHNELREMLSHIFSLKLSVGASRIVFALFLLGDSLFSSFILYVFVQVVDKKTSRLFQSLF